MTVLVADDHPVVRQGLRTFLATQEDLDVVGEAATCTEAAERAAELQPDVVLLDLVMPGGDGIEAARKIREASPESKVIVLTSYPDDATVLPALEAGAAGYLLKDVEPQELADGVRRVHRGESLLHPAVAPRVIREAVGPAAADCGSPAAHLGPPQTSRRGERLRPLSDTDLGGSFGVEPGPPMRS